MEEKKEKIDLSLRELFVLKLLLFVVKWLGKDIEGFYYLDIDKICADCGVREKKEWE